MPYAVNYWRMVSLSNWQQAKDYYEKTKPWRGRADQNSRPVGTRRQTDTTIRKEGEDYVIRYHSTDVVRYHVDGSLSLEAYASLSTNSIARRFLPSGLSIDYNHHGFFIGILNKERSRWDMHRVSEKFRLHPQPDGGWMIEGTLPLVRTSVNKQAANKIYKEVGYKDFAAFMRAAEKLNPPEEVTSWRKYTQHWSCYLNDQDVMNFFDQGLDGWHKLAEALPRPTQTLEVVRMHLIRRYKCIDKHEIECTSWGNLRSVLQSNAKWR